MKTLGVFLSDGALIGSLTEHGLDKVGDALGEVPARARAVVAKEVGRVGAEILDLSLGDVLLGAWSGWTAVRDATRESRDDPATPRVVDLARHVIDWTHRPYVDVLVDDVPVCRVNLTVELKFTVAGITVVIRAGRIAEVRSGDVELTATVTVEGTQVARCKKRLDIGAAISLGEQPHGTIYRSMA
jgi:hypothetical protein